MGGGGERGSIEIELMYEHYHQNLHHIYPMGGAGTLVKKSEYKNVQGCVHGGSR